MRRRHVGEQRHSSRLLGARNKGDAVCANRRTIGRATVEGEVLGALRTRLMAPDVYRSFVAGFTAEWNKEQDARDAERAGKRDELKRVARKVGNIVDAIAENGTSGALQAALRQQEERKAVLAHAEATAPRLMPNLADLYRTKVAELQAVLSTEELEPARERVRALVDEIHLIPSPSDPRAPLRIEVRGHLAAMLALTSGSKVQAAAALAAQMNMVAGAGFEPAAFRL